MSTKTENLRERRVLQLMATDKVQGVYFDDTEVRHMSTTTGYVVDLVCESEISGLVTKTIKTTDQTQQEQ